VPGAVAASAFAAEAAWSLQAHYPAARGIPSCAELAAGGDFAAEGLESSHAHWRRQRVQAEAQGWVRSALSAGKLAVPPPPASRKPPLAVVPPVDRSILGPQFFDAASRTGVVLYEPFGGLCAGLEMVLRTGLAVQRYIYQDIDPAAQLVARHRVATLQGRYPGLLPRSAVEGMFTTLPMDIRAVTRQQLVAAGAGGSQQWLMVAGWECQDLSSAGTGKGLAGPRSRTFFDTVRVLRWLQELQPGLPPGYILENAPMQVGNKNPRVAAVDFPAICAVIGSPVLLDAAQVGAPAHRLRNYWTNLAAAWQVSAALSGVQRSPGRCALSQLDPGRSPQVARVRESPPYHPCNTPGEMVCVLPTLVATVGSYAFRDGQIGLVRDAAAGSLSEPNPAERERLLGYDAGCTAALGVTPLQRHQITGRCMDARAMECLLAVCAGLAATQPFYHVAAAARAPAAAWDGGKGLTLLSLHLAPGEAWPLGPSDLHERCSAGSRLAGQRWALGSSRGAAKAVAAGRPAGQPVVFRSGGMLQGFPLASASLASVPELGGE